MGGGLMQLVAYGAQDVYLTGNPQITFWKVVYRRHTNFAIECIEHTLSGNPDFGRKASVTILRNGDLAYRIKLYVHLDAVTWNTNQCEEGCKAPRMAWVRRLGHALIKHVEVTIGGSTIDKQYGIWLDLWHELTHTDEQERGYREMIGDVDELTRLDEPNCQGKVKPSRRLYIPLQFWFNRNSGLALPLIALQYHEVRLDFDFEDVNKLIVWQTDDLGSLPDFRGMKMKEASILVDYVYLDSVERRRFAQVGHEYLIEQVQYTGYESINGNGTRAGNIHYKSKLNFNHPTKELIWVVRNSTFAGDDRASSGFGNGHKFLAYTNKEGDHAWQQALNEAANNIANGMICLEKRGCSNNNCNLTDQEVHVALNGPVVMADVLTRRCPSHYIRFNIFVNGTGINNLSIQRYPLYNGQITNEGASGFNYADYIDEVQVNINACDGTFVATVVAHHLDINDISVPTDSNGLIDQRYNTNQTANPNDVFVIQTFNYGLRLDYRGNPVDEAVIQLNGHDRFDPRHGSYFNYVVPYECHTHTPQDGVNVYSFALNPEQHQPSGTCNLSRIDSTILALKLADPTRQYFGEQSNLVVNIGDSNLFVFAFSYNVLRIMSGMGGLAYSN